MRHIFVRAVAAVIATIANIRFKYAVRVVTLIIIRLTRYLRNITNSLKLAAVKKLREIFKRSNRTSPHVFGSSESSSQSDVPSQYHDLGIHIPDFSHLNCFSGSHWLGDTVATRKSENFNMPPTKRNFAKYFNILTTS